MVINRAIQMNPHIPASFRTLDLNLLRVFDEVMAERSTPADLHSRYNGLMMAIAASEIETAECYIDPYGAFSFRVGDDANVLMGDSSGTFAMYNNAAAVRERLREAENEAMTA